MSQVMWYYTRGLKDNHRSFIYFICFNYQNTGYLENIIFMINRCHHSFAAESTENMNVI